MISMIFVIFFIATIGCTYIICYFKERYIVNKNNIAIILMIFEFFIFMLNLLRLKINVFAFHLSYPITMTLIISIIVPFVLEFLLNSLRKKDSVIIAISLILLTTYMYFIILQHFQLLYKFYFIVLLIVALVLLYINNKEALLQKELRISFLLLIIICGSIFMWFVIENKTIIISRFQSYLNPNDNNFHYYIRYTLSNAKLIGSCNMQNVSPFRNYYYSVYTGYIILYYLGWIPLLGYLCIIIGYDNLLIKILKMNYNKNNNHIIFDIILFYLISTILLNIFTVFGSPLVDIVPAYAFYSSYDYLICIGIIIYYLKKLMVKDGYYKDI